MIRLSLASNGDLIYVSVDKIVGIRDAREGCMIIFAPDWFLIVREPFQEVLEHLVEEARQVDEAAA